MIGSTSLRQSSLFARVVLLALLGAGAIGTSAADNDAQLDRLQARLDHARAEHRRWQRLIDTERELTVHPEKFAEAANDAARSLKASGRDLAIEGLTGGISSMLKLDAEAVGPGTKAGRAYKTSAARVEALSNDVIKDYARRGDPEIAKPSEENSRAIDKLEATLKLAADAVKDPKLKEALSASVGMHVAAFQFLNAYLVDDKPGMSKYFPATKSMLEGTLDVLRGMAAHPAPDKLEGYLKAVAREVPEFAPLAKALATTAIEDVNFTIAAASIGGGVWAFNEGLALSARAIDIRDNQMLAAKNLRRLLPRARIELAHAEEEERRASAAIAALTGKAPALPRVVRPSERVVDDAVGAPGAALQAFDAIAALGPVPPLKHGITPQALQRLEDKFRRESRSDLERRAAEQRAREEAARREAEAREAARRVALQQFEWARERAQESRERAQESSGRSERSSSSDREWRGGSYDLSRARRAVESMPSIGASLGRQ